jgi:hypothetical protein
VDRERKAARIATGQESALRSQNETGRLFPDEKFGEELAGACGVGPIAILLSPKSLKLRRGVSAIGGAIDVEEER